ncbi:fatty acid--CoA ligase family protein [Stigmatella sp. ncwal1]|uniref:Fatty acid--CoA ligase family protein n=1 Tax=Stigmatella ashevillensis TaxID=2995309 RepID=A0ABT5DCK4_9BACT|nr:fatty acid--CoA ligase family protein [Stigmatella ashevillena]MDC0711353.1 fatty acid--CoA ligase family protein [Stigmatella ashevillena]
MSTRSEQREPAPELSAPGVSAPGIAFGEVYARALSAASRHQSLLTDGRLSLSYAELSGHFTHLDAFFASRGIAPGSILALECVNSVPGALSLLYVMSRGFSLVLLPPPGKAAPSVPVPRFCHHRLTVQSQLVDGADIVLHRPETFLQCPRSEEPVLSLDAAHATGKIFLRTSGSIGTPKLAMYTHGQLLANALNAVERLHLSGADRIALPVPLCHMFGLGAGFLPGFAVGASLGFVEGANILRYLEHERQFRPTVAFMTPALCSMFLRQHSAPEHYRHVVLAGDKLKPESFDAAEARFRRAVLLYGTTEMGVIAASDAEASEGPRSTTVGPPLPGIELKLEQPSAPGEAPEVVAGAIVCRHPHGFEGYVDNDGGPWTGEPPFHEGWYRTRDWGRLHAGGLLEVLGRQDHSVNRDGRLVLLAEVERALEGIPDVAQAITLLGAENLRGRHILALCTPREGRTLDSVQVRAACANLLPPYATPDEVRILPSFPLLPNGKVDRRTLMAQFTGTASPPASEQKENLT